MLSLGGGRFVSFRRPLDPPVRHEPDQGEGDRQDVEEGGDKGLEEAGYGGGLAVPGRNDGPSVGLSPDFYRVRFCNILGLGVQRFGASSALGAVPASPSF